MPDDVTYASTLAADLKVSEIDIIYKSSDQTSLKVIDTILVSDLAATNDKQYVYTYNSQAPIRTLPESEIARVADKAPDTLNLLRLIILLLQAKNLFTVKIIL